MKESKIDLKEEFTYHKKQIYGTKVNLNRASKPSEKQAWQNRLNALKKSMKQLKKK